MKVKELIGSSFTCLAISAGAADALFRIALAYDIVTSFYKLDFYAPSYTNYHCPDVDFFGIFGVYKSFPTSADQLHQALVKINLSDLVAALLEGRPALNDGTNYEIVPDLYAQDPRIKNLREHVNLTLSFVKKLQYQITREVFDAGTKTVKAVIHLRRQDILGDIILFGPEADLIPEDIKRGIHRRPLLYFQHAIDILERSVPAGSAVDLVITSDGVREIRKKVGRFPGMSERLDGIELEFMGNPTSNKLGISVIDRIVGTGPDETIRTLDAMFSANVVVTASSSFPRLPCAVGGAKLIVVDPTELEKWYTAKKGYHC